MMQISRTLALAALGLLLIGCGGGETETPPAGETALGAPGDIGAVDAFSQSTDGAGSEAGTAAEEATPPAGETTTIALTPDNTQIQFIGTHNRENLDPRTCEFTDFSGAASLNANGELEAVNVVIQTDGITTFNNDLTNHLKNEDFLDVRQHETITFETTSIESVDESTTLNGNLTLMGTTKEVRFPAEVTVADGRLSLTGSLTINRSDYGMDKMLDRVNDAVEINVTVDAGG